MTLSCVTPLSSGQCGRSWRLARPVAERAESIVVGVADVESDDWLVFPTSAGVVEIDLKDLDGYIPLAQPLLAGDSRWGHHRLAFAVAAATAEWATWLRREPEAERLSDQLAAWAGSACHEKDSQMTEAASTGTTLQACPAPWMTMSSTAVPQPFRAAIAAARSGRLRSNPDQLVMG